MELKAKVFNDGTQWIARFPTVSRSYGSGKHVRSEKAMLFDQYYLEAQKAKIPKKKISSYIEDRFCGEQDISLWLASDESRELLKNKQRNLHKRKKRYRNKLFNVPWNYFVTFTYDDAKETEESFVKRLKKTFSNFKTRHGWLVMAIPEEGEKTGRKHYHAFVYVPQGKMVGDLFLQKKYSEKKRKMTTFTDNTYFNQRFGQSVWAAINQEDLRGGLSSYLTKYFEKSGNRFFYSRGIPTELEMMIDTETDIIATYYNYGVKAVLFDFFHKKVSDLSDYFRFEEGELFGYDLDRCPIMR